MLIATFNINSITKRLANLIAWLEVAQPDIVCLQELKCTQRTFPAKALEAAGYHAVWRGQPSWNGVAILSRLGKPVLIRDALPGGEADDQARYIEAAIRGMVIGCLYAPNGNPQPGPKFDYKISWHARLKAHADALRSAGVPVILAGDYNVAPTEIDVYPTKSYDGNALVQPASRAAFKALVDSGWTDALRHKHRAERVYTFWDYMRNRWPRDAGMRLDHILLSPDLAKRLTTAGVDRTVRGEDGASDHAPAWVRLKR